MENQMKAIINKLFTNKKPKIVFKTISNTKVVVNEKDVAHLFAISFKKEEFNLKKFHIFLNYSIEKKVHWCKLNIDDKELHLLENAILLRGGRNEKVK